MTNLPNAPLVYTLGVVHFPTVPGIKRFADSFHDAIRSRYPRSGQFDLPQVSVTMGSEGLRVDQREATVWQFGSPDQSWAFILTPQILALHTVSYTDHVEFVDHLRFGLERLVAVPDVGISYVEAVGIRYVDQIVPLGDEMLPDYLKPSVLPPAFDEIPGLSLAEGIYVSRYTTEEGELRFQVLRNPPTVLPPELESPLTQQNGWKMPRPEREFAVVDIDYGTRFAGLKPMDVATVCDHVLRLRGTAKAVFENIGTDHAQSVWRGDA